MLLGDFENAPGKRSLGPASVSIRENRLVDFTVGYSGERQDMF
jgi:hypothetical protein